MHSHDTLETVQARIRVVWATRRSCGLFASAAVLRVARLIERRDAGHADPGALLRQALEAEAATLLFAPLDPLEVRRAGL
ncbi:hypothetical protein ACSD7O_19390 [Methylorubrum extorquens]|uniref:hypothetical protein n=1 Tax=Methylorubrum extorquens TaxID=408 RepID=UPI003F600264